MPRTPAKILLCLALPCIAPACASAGRAGAGAGAVASRGAAAGAETLDVAYHGVGGAVETPFRDFNLMRERIPAVLAHATVAPYDMKGLKDCEALGEEIAQLDLALGPDLDTPDVEGGRDLYGRGAGLAADAAIDAMTHAAVGYIPMRSVIRRLSGADALQKKVKRAVLAGSVRRGFLKALGMERGCPWPAAPLDSAPPSVVIAAGPAVASELSERTAAVGLLVLPVATSPGVSAAPLAGAPPPTPVAFRTPLAVSGPGAASR